MLAPAAPLTRAVTLTQSGRGLDLLAPKSDAVSIRDIAAHLAKICRFAGACNMFYSVAQHSVLVSTLLRDKGPLIALYGLLHDAHEAYLGDVTRPAREAIDVLTDGCDTRLPAAILRLEANLDAAIHAALGLAWPLDATSRRYIREADMRALATEKRDLMPDEPEWPDLPAPWRAAIKPWPWTKAEERFVATYDDLAGAVGLPPVASHPR